MMKIGMSHRSETVVNSTNTAIAAGSGNLEVFATPQMVALMENAAMRAVIGALADGDTTVGVSIEVLHTRATPMGQSVMATATLENVDGRKLSFKVVAEDSKGVIGEGRHERVVVGIERFMAKL